MFEIIDWQYKSIYTWCTHKCSNYVLTIQRKKKKWVKKEPSQVGNHRHIIRLYCLILRSYGHIMYVWRQCCSGTVCTNTDKFLAGLSCTLLTAGKNHTKSRRRYYANNQLTIQNYYIPFHTIATLHLTKKKYSN